MDCFDFWDLTQELKARVLSGQITVAESDAIWAKAVEDKVWPF